MLSCASLLFTYSAHDIDQEIKECAIAAMGVLLARMGRELGAEVPNVLALLMDRLRNEITRVSAASNAFITSLSNTIGSSSGTAVTIGTAVSASGAAISSNTISDCASDSLVMVLFATAEQLLAANI
jgi:cullin-associated NEDD8-dissociated protein 1